jgi:hypothetical protein
MSARVSVSDPMSGFFVLRAGLLHDTVRGLSAIAGILIGAVWNYAVTAVYTWRTR